MITIESIRLRNFRSIREAFFRPLEDGISVIMGSNGAGKTTLLAGLLFALYGVRPPGASMASLRRKNSDTAEECSVSVVFKHLDQEIEVIRELKGSNNRVVLNIFVDGVETTVTSVGSGDAWIRQRLGIDANSFLTAFAVRQKELDSLINATPAVRKQIIEKLAGIEVINEALKNARKNENDTKATLESLPGSQTAVEEAETQVLLLNDKVEELTRVSQKIKERVDSQTQSEREAEDTVTKLRSLETSLMRDRDQLNNLVEADRNNQENLYRLRYLDNVQEDQSLESLRERHRQLTNDINAKRQQYSENIVNRKNMVDRNKDLLIEIRDLQPRVAEMEKELSDKTPEELFVEKNKAEELISTLFSESSQLQARERDLRESISLLGHSTECPTCHTHLEDPHALVTSLTALADEVAASYSEKTHALTEAKDASLQIQDMLNKFTHVEELKQRVATLEEQRATLLQNLIPEETLEDWQQEITVMEEERTNVTEIGQKLSSIEADRKLRASLQSKVEEAGVRINDLRAKVAEMEKTFSPQKLTQAENVYNTIRRERDELNRQWTDVSAELASYSSRLTIANNTYKSVTEQWKRKSELLKAQEKNGLTTALLDKFRRETIASLTPELSENASELISDITNGAYTEIIVDDDFNISVINSMGDSRSIGELSGGEESAVALSLRLAIGLLITGRSPEFLWMDEVLTAQDADRRSSMLETIRGLPYKQIIMVSHTEDAGDIADLTVTVIPDLKRGSTLEITSAIGGTHDTQEDSE